MEIKNKLEEYRNERAARRELKRAKRKAWDEAHPTLATVRDAAVIGFITGGASVVGGLATAGIANLVASKRGKSKDEDAEVVEDAIEAEVDEVEETIETGEN